MYVAQLMEKADFRGELREREKISVTRKTICNILVENCLDSSKYLRRINDRASIQM